MAIPEARPWAILLCRYTDDQNDPATTTIAQLAQQWRNVLDQAFIDGNLTPPLNPPWDNDQRTLLELCQNFFTVTGIFTFNSVRYWDECSHGTISTADSEVFPCVIPRTTAQSDARYNALKAQVGGSTIYQHEIFKEAYTALLQQHGRNSADFAALAVCFQRPDYGAQGGPYPTAPGVIGGGVFMDIRYVKNNGTQLWAQEMGHAFGIDHSRVDGVLDAMGQPANYTDPWDGMSTRSARSTRDPHYGMRGPGLNAWNMRGRGWLDESRIWKSAQANFDNEVVVLRPLHHRNLPGYLGAELPGIGGHSSYLLELRVPSYWDAGIGAPSVVVRRFEGKVGQFLNTHSYIMPGTNGQLGLGVGDSFDFGTNSYARAKVISIDLAGNSATIELSHKLLSRTGLANERKLPNLWWHPLRLGQAAIHLIRALLDLVKAGLARIGLGRRR